MKQAFWLSLLIVLSPGVAQCQSITPESVGIQPLSGNFDVWPDFLAWGNNNRMGLTMAAIGPDPVTGQEEFVVVGASNPSGNTDGSGQGWKKVIIDRNGVVVDLGGFIGDNGTTDITFPFATGVGVRFQQDTCVRANRRTGEFITAVCIRESENYKTVLGANSPAAFNYWSAGSPIITDEKVNFQRFNRDGVPVCDVTVGRNIPAGNDLGSGDPNWVGGIRTRPGGCGILSNGNSFFGITSRSSNLNSNEISAFVLPGHPIGGPVYGTGNDDVTTYTVMNAAATTFVAGITASFQTLSAPGVFLRPDAPGFKSPKSEAQQGGASDYVNGWFCQHQDEMIAVRDNAGTLIAYATNTNADQNPNGNSIALPSGFANAVDRGTWFDREQDMAAGGNRIARMATAVDNNNGGIIRRLFELWEVDPVGGSLTPLGFFLLDDDFNNGAGPSANPGTNNQYRRGGAIDVDEDGSVVAAWRTAENFAAVARVFDNQGAPLTGSFYVSGLPDPTLDNNALTGVSDDSAKLEVAKSGNTVCVVWSSDNAVANLATVDVNGFTKSPPRSQVARVFQLPEEVDATNVDSWYLYQ